MAHHKCKHGFKTKQKNGVGPKWWPNGIETWAKKRSRPKAEDVCSNAMWDVKTCQNF